MWYWLFKYVFMGPLLTLLGRPKVVGLENVPDRGAVILASNHLAVADSFYKCLVVRRRITYLAKAEYFTGTVRIDAPISTAGCLFGGYNLLLFAQTPGSEA